MPRRCPWRSVGRGAADVAQMVVVAVLASAIGIAFGLAIDWFPADASSQAGRSTRSGTSCSSRPSRCSSSCRSWSCSRSSTSGCGRARRTSTGRPSTATTPGDHLDGHPGDHHRRPLRLRVHGAERHRGSAGRPERQVTVIGQQFAWTFEYNEGGRKFANTQLYLPVDESVKFNVRSTDVIHDFLGAGLPHEDRRRPGITTHYRVTPTQTGQHEIVCAELCGLGHAYMRQTAHVLSRRTSTPGSAARRAPGPPAAAGGAGGEGADEQSGGGAATRAPRSCSSTATAGRTPRPAAPATLADAGTNGQTGPNLDEVLQGKDAAFIEQSIIDPTRRSPTATRRASCPATTRTR